MQNMSLAKKFGVQGMIKEPPMSAMQQQMVNDKQYKSISYHKQKQSYD
jgi:hypothetical protein